MADKVLLIEHGTNLATNVLIAALAEAGVGVAKVEPSVEQIRAEKDGADVLLLFAGDYLSEAPEVLICLKDLCFGEEKALCVAGSGKELAEVERIIPKRLIEQEFIRPVDIKGIAAKLSTLAGSDRSREQKKHILLVDDDVMFLQMMQSWLGKKYRVTAVKSGMQAITYIAAHTPDLILLDYDMPITPGTQVLEMIRSEPSSASIPVIFLTGKTDRESMTNVVRLRPDGYLLKLMGKEKILSSVEHFFETRKWENVYM